MKTECLIVFSSICVCLSFCYPSKPLNERSTELAWEAWLLVDQSNRGDMGMLRRRITPKSVFIAPTFSPESLPACADGYKSDMMGRCVKIIKINESVHFDFLREKLSAQFLDYEDEVVETSTRGPLQFNIPLFGDFEEKLDENETEVAIVVTPSNKNHRDKTVQVDIRRNSGDKFRVEDVAAILGLKPEEVEMTTIAELGTTVAMSTTLQADEGTTLETTTEVGTTTEIGTTEMSTTTESTETTTVLEEDALFFLRV